jgi:hypothetical protein
MFRDGFSHSQLQGRYRNTLAVVKRLLKPSLGMRRFLDPDGYELAVWSKR